MCSVRVGARRGAGFRRRLAWFALLTGIAAVRVDAGDLLDRTAPTRRVIVVPAARSSPTARTEVNNYGGLGTFYPTPYMMVRGNAPAGGGYSPLGTFGDTTLALYGPLSSLRMTSAPVMTYTRGYDGRSVVVPGTSFSTPNLPALTPVVNPSQANYYYGFRRSGTPPWWSSGVNWIDQN